MDHERAEELCAARSDEELLAIIDHPDDWDRLLLVMAERELGHRGVPFRPVRRTEEAQGEGWIPWALGTALFGAASVLLISRGWGPRAAGLVVLPACGCLGMMVRRIMGR